MTPARKAALQWFKRVTAQRADLDVDTWPSRATVKAMLDDGEIAYHMGGALCLTNLGRSRLHGDDA